MQRVKIIMGHDPEDSLIILEARLSDATDHD